MRIYPNDKFIEIFAKRFHYFEDPFYKFFALNLLFQNTSYSLALKYSSLLFKFFNFAFYNINFWFKISKICPKIMHFSQISHARGNTGRVSKCLKNIDVLQYSPHTMENPNLRNETTSTPKRIVGGFHAPKKNCNTLATT